MNFRLVFPKGSNVPVVLYLDQIGFHLNNIDIKDINKDCWEIHGDLKEFTSEQVKWYQNYEQIAIKLGLDHQIRKIICDEVTKKYEKEK